MNTICQSILIFIMRMKHMSSTDKRKYKRKWEINRCYLLARINKCFFDQEVTKGKLTKELNSKK